MACGPDARNLDPAALRQYYAVRAENRLTLPAQLRSPKQHADNDSTPQLSDAKEQAVRPVASHLQQPMQTCTPTNMQPHATDK
jgi:hypothetical protein